MRRGTGLGSLARCFRTRLSAICQTTLMSEVALQKIGRRLTVQQIEQALSRSLKERYNNNMVITERGNRNSFFGILIKKLASISNLKLFPEIGCVQRASCYKWVSRNGQGVLADASATTCMVFLSRMLSARSCIGLRGFFAIASIGLRNFNLQLRRLLLVVLAHSLQPPLIN